MRAFITIYRENTPSVDSSYRLYSAKAVIQEMDRSFQTTTKGRISIYADYLQWEPKRV